VEKLAAIIEAAGTRLRPILMTTAATVIGHFPLDWPKVREPALEIVSASCW
jgi:multidrug efflux pump subunit AcrB